MTDLFTPYLTTWDKTRYKRAFLWGGQSELEVQTEVVDALRISRVDVEVVDAGSNTLRLAFMRVLHACGIPEEKVKMIMSRVRNVGPSSDPGRSDLSGALAPNGRSFYIEMKAPAKIDPVSGKQLRAAGKASPEQLAFLARRYAEGCIVGVAYSVDDAFEILGADNLAAHQAALRSVLNHS
jgi:hypothetical protein